MKTLILSLVLVLLNGPAAGVSNNDIVDYHGSLNSVETSAYHSTVNTIYGLIGTNGKAPSLGIVYNGSVSSSKYKKSFSFEKTKEYTAALPVYIKAWGKVFVNTNSGEYNYGTTVKSSWE